MNKTTVFHWGQLRVEHTLDNENQLESFTLYFDGVVKLKVVNRVTERLYNPMQRLIEVTQKKLGLEADKMYYPIGLGAIIEDNSFELKQDLHNLEEFFRDVLINPQEAYVNVRPTNLKYVSTL
ncbi:MAG: hypothetical protein ACRCVU_05015 [Flavobacterium sp.]